MGSSTALVCSSMGVARIGAHAVHGIPIIRARSMKAGGRVRMIRR